MATYLDNFDRANGALGDLAGLTWESISGSWAIASNKPHTTTAHADSPIAALETGAADVDMSVDADGGDALYARVLDGANWLRARVRRYTSSNPVTEYKWAKDWTDSNTEYLWQKDWLAYPPGEAGNCQAWGSFSGQAPAIPNCSPYENAQYGSPFYTGTSREVVGATGACSAWGPSPSSPPTIPDCVPPAGRPDVTYGAPYNTGETRVTGATTTTRWALILEKSVGGVVTELGNVTVDQPGSIRLKATGTTIEVYRATESSPRISVTESAHETETKHGIGRGASDVDVESLDDFSIGLSFAPNAPTLSTPVDGGTIYNDQENFFSFSATDPDPSDSLSAYALKRTIGATTRYWKATTETWEAAETFNALVLPFPVAFRSIPVAAFKLNAAGAMTWSVAVKDSGGKTSAYSTTRTVTIEANDPAGPTVPLTDPAVLESLRGTKRPRKLHFAYELLDQGFGHKAWLSGVKACSVGNNSAAEIKRTASLTLLDGLDDIAVTDMVRPWCRVIMPSGQAAFPLGVFLLPTPVEEVTEGSKLIVFEGYDQSQILLDDKVTARYVVLGGTNTIIDEVRTLLNSSSIVKQNLTATAKTLYGDLTWEPGTPKLTIINALLRTINYMPLYFDAAGYAIARPYVVPTDAAPAYEYRDDAESVIHQEAQRSLDLFSVPNIWVVMVSDADRELTSTYENDNPDSPTSTVTRGRDIVNFRSAQPEDAVDQTTLDALAERIAFEESQVYETVNFTSAIMPVHEEAEVLWLEHGRLGADAKYQEVAWSFELTVGARMNHAVRRVVGVSA